MLALAVVISWFGGVWCGVVWGRAVVVVVPLGFGHAGAPRLFIPMDADAIPQCVYVASATVLCCTVLLLVL